jgi:homoserine kinase
LVFDFTFAICLLPFDFMLMVRVPASTSNLGAGFDCFGLALKLYLNVEARIETNSDWPCHVEVMSGETQIARDASNLIYRAMLTTADRLNRQLPPVRLTIHNEIPLGSGLGSSGAAIVAGIALANGICNGELTREDMLQIATAMEGHPDNVSASIFGGWTINCAREDKRAMTIRRDWPDEIKIVAVTPYIQLETKRARSVLPLSVSHKDAVYNLQRAAFFAAAVELRHFDSIKEAMRDSLHQPYRQNLIPGLKEALAVDDIEGLLGVAISGAGPSALALAIENFDAIGKAIADCFQRNEIETTVRLLEAEKIGIQISDSSTHS